MSKMLVTVGGFSLLVLSACQPPSEVSETDAQMEAVASCPSVDVPDGQFRLTLAEDVVFQPGSPSHISVCVHRGLGMEGHISLVTQGQPQFVEVEARENRVGDGITLIEVYTSNDEEFGPPAEYFPNRFTITATSGLFGARETLSVPFTFE